MVFRSISYLPILGLDCEWVTKNEIRQPVALLQIADNDGMCYLIRLSKFKTISSSLTVNIKFNTNKMHLYLYLLKSTFILF